MQNLQRPGKVDPARADAHRTPPTGECCVNIVLAIDGIISPLKCQGVKQAASVGQADRELATIRFLEITVDCFLPTASRFARKPGAMTDWASEHPFRRR